MSQTQPPQGGPFLNNNELSEYFGCSKSRISQLLRDPAHLGPVAFRLGGRWVVSKADADAYAERVREQFQARRRDALTASNGSR